MHEPEFEIVEPDFNERVQLSDIFALLLPEFERESAGYFRRVIRNSGYQFLIIREKSDPVSPVLGGVCFSYREPLGIVELHYNAIAPNCQGMGVGRRLIDGFKSHLAHAGFHFVATYADVNAIGFYLKNNFVKERSREIPPSMISRYMCAFLNAIIMELNLQDHPDQRPVKKVFDRKISAIKKAVDSGKPVYAICQRQSRCPKTVIDAKFRISEVNTRIGWVKAGTGWYHINSCRVTFDRRFDQINKEDDQMSVSESAPISPGFEVGSEVFSPASPVGEVFYLEVTIDENNDNSVAKVGCLGGCADRIQLKLQNGDQKLDMSCEVSPDLAERQIVVSRTVADKLSLSKGETIQATQIEEDDDMLQEEPEVIQGFFKKRNSQGSKPMNFSLR